jgi:predicted O-methyltransferase YrrM
LHKILTYHESISAFQDRTMFELIQGDATKTVDTWLENNPGASIALAIFDMDVYAPTKDVLEKIMPRLTKNSVLVFDEFVHRKFPGEVQAVREVLDLMNADVSISEFQSHCAIVRFT